MAALKHRITLPLDGDVHAEHLQEMLGQVPPTVKLKTVVHHTPADRPWESAHTRVEVFAEWSEDI